MNVEIVLQVPVSPTLVTCSVTLAMAYDDCVDHFDDYDDHNIEGVCDDYYDDHDPKTIQFS